jgi:hypothetical protein
MLFIIKNNWAQNLLFVLEHRYTVRQR